MLVEGPHEVSPSRSCGGIVGRGILFFFFFYLPGIKVGGTAKLDGDGLPRVMRSSDM